MRCLIILLLITQFQIAISQNETSNFKFRVYLNEKDTSIYQNVNPLTYLSLKAIDRRIEQAVELDASDYPISSTCKETIQKLGFALIAESKWLNTLVVQCVDSIKIREIEELSFVDSVRFVWRGFPQGDYERMRPRLWTTDSSAESLHDSWFGISEPQFQLHNATHMHNAGFRGKAVDIAVIDGGFTNTDVIPAFVHSFILDHKNFVPDGELFSAFDHGTKVLSTMALNLPHKVMGSAPEANYYLLRSEDEATEFPVEEDYWLAAIEYADSIGVRLVNTSLGYSHFDDSTLNYTHKELTGKSSLISRAASMASDKGMLIVCSAGNEGNIPWGKVVMPADSEKVLAIGAVSLDSTIVSFSSMGPTADGRIKPDLVSVGAATVIVGQTGEIGSDNGTSLSSPFLAGLIGSLWSVNPQLHREELIDIVVRSAHQFHNPDTIFGYGVPDFKIAYQEVLKTLKLEVDSATTDIIKVSKTANDFLIIALNEPTFEPHSYSVRILDEKGNTIVAEKFKLQDYIFQLTEQVKKENSELYIVVQSPFGQSTVRFKIK